MDKSHPRVSVIIPTLDSEKTLEACLRSVRSSDYPADRIELIVVDGHSEDASTEIAKKYGAIVLEGGRDGPTMARIRALRTATGSVIAFTDADAVVDRRWIANAVRHLQSNPRNVVGGPLRASNQKAFAKAMQALFDLPELLKIGMGTQIVIEERTVAMLPTANFVMPVSGAEIFRDATWNGYGGDHMLSAKLRENGYSLVAYPDVVVQHKKRETPWEAIKEIFKWGKGSPAPHTKVLYILYWFIPLSIAYVLLSALFFGVQRFPWIIAVPLIPVCAEAAWAGIRNRSIAVALWSPLAFACYACTWSAGYMYQRFRLVKRIPAQTITRGIG